ncbi:MAG TPA: GNAT family N-acetyltransferase [Chloroflexia bacterium]|nr:GNAT family N-acetyltransferase [Chloroflexia bacterium]
MTLSLGSTEVNPAAVWQMRSYREGDIPAIVEFINAVDAVDQTGRATSVPELTESYAMPLSDPQRQVVILEAPELSGLGKGSIAGYARMLWLDDTATGERIYQIGTLAAHPGAKGLGIERALAVRLMEIARANEAREETAPMEKVWVLGGAKEKMSAIRDLYKEMGLKEVRWGWKMERSLVDAIAEPQPVEGTVLRNYRRPEDNPQFLEAYDASFIDHFEYHALPADMFDYMLGTAHVRPEFSWLAEVEGEAGKLAGFCLCEINDAENARSGKLEGWIALLGTVRGWRGKGLGRALLLKGLLSLREAGMETALLGVDSESPTGANRLYESVGFKIRDYEVLCKGALADVVISA